MTIYIVTQVDSISKSLRFIESVWYNEQDAKAAIYFHMVQTRLTENEYVIIERKIDSVKYWT